MPTTTASAITRRTALRRTGQVLATALVLGTGAVAYRAYDQGVLDAGEGPAYRPWRTWRDGDGQLRLVRAAVLAPSPHNAQPWLFGLAPEHIDVHVDASRRLGAADPFDRELHVGLGAAIENLTLAARAEGYASTVEPVVGGGSHVARITLTRTPARASELYEQIPRRHTNRYPFVTDRPVPAAALAAMSALALPDVEVVWITEPNRRHEFGELVVGATEAFVADAEQRAGDHRWFRSSWDRIQRDRDGITLDAAGLAAPIAAIAKLLPAPSPASMDESWLTATRDRHTRTAAAYGIVTVRDAGDVVQRLRGGRTLQRVHLWATGAGLGLHHMNQVTERADREVQLGIERRFGDAIAALVPSGWQALSSFRIGVPTREATPSPRRAVEAVTVR